MATDLKLKNEDGTYNQQITVTGYSLGWHLATAFHILHQNDNLIKNTFTFNGAGVGSIGGDDVILGEDGDDNLRGDFDDRAESKIFADVNGDDIL